MDNQNKAIQTTQTSNAISPIRCREIREVLTSGKPQISALIKTHGETVVADAVRALIVGVCENISVGKNMTENQIRFAGEIIVEKFWYLKLEDFSLCFRRGLVGDYGLFASVYLFGCDVHVVPVPPENPHPHLGRTETTRR